MTGKHSHRLSNIFKKITGSQGPAVKELETQFKDIIETDSQVLKKYQRDSWAFSEIEDFQGKNNPLPLAVVKPETTNQISDLLKFCNQHKIAVIPYGSGSGVCGAIKAEKNTVVLSLEKLNGLIELNEDDMIASFWAGTNGKVAEDTVQDHGLTIGHWPQSIDISSVGGWVSTKASGQYSTAYGNIEDMILDLEAVLPDGSIINSKQAPRAAAGFDLRQLFLGTEGAHGIVTKVSFSLRKLPEKTLGQAFSFNDMNQGLKAIQDIVQSGLKPAVVRLYDPTETQRHFPNQFNQGQSSLFLIHEGAKELVKAESNLSKSISKNNGGKAVSSKLVEQWLNNRNKVPTFRELLEQGIVADTIEVSAPYSKISDLYNNVVNALNGVQGVVMASGHSSHSYRSGTNLYFTFAAIPKDKKDMSSVYKQCWDAAMQATIKSGGSIVHHHGVGRVRRAYLKEEIGESGIKALHKIKNALDENGVLNPDLYKLDNQKNRSMKNTAHFKPNS